MPGWKKLFSSSGGHLVRPRDKPEAIKGKAAIDHQGRPFDLWLGKQRLRFHPEEALATSGKASPRDWIVFDPDQYFSSIAGFARIERGRTVLFGRENEELDRIFGFPKSVMKRHLKISNNKGDLALKELDPDGETSIAALGDDDDGGTIANNAAMMSMIFLPVWTPSSRAAW